VLLVRIDARDQGGAGDELPVGERLVGLLEVLQDALVDHADPLLVYLSGDGNLPGHGRMADKEILVRGADVENEHLLRLSLPPPVRILRCHIEAQGGLSSYGETYP
jgi:hypothetical protein